MRKFNLDPISKKDKDLSMHIKEKKKSQPMVSYNRSLSNILKKDKEDTTYDGEDSQSVSYLSNFLSNFIKTTKILVSNPY